MSRYINPHRGEGEYWLMYTTAEGGMFNIIGASPEMYMSIIEKGYFEMKTGDRPVAKIYPSYVELVKTIDGYDFILRNINNSKEYD